MTDDRCWTHPDYIRAAEEHHREVDGLTVRNANLAEQLTLLRDRTGTPGLQGLIHEMRQSFMIGSSWYWADRLEALARGDVSPVPRTQEEKVAFRIWWDGRVDAAREKEAP